MGDRGELIRGEVGRWGWRVRVLRADQARDQVHPRYERDRADPARIMGGHGSTVDECCGAVVGDDVAVGRAGRRFGPCSDGERDRFESGSVAEQVDGVGGNGEPEPLAGQLGRRCQLMERFPTDRVGRWELAGPLDHERFSVPPRCVKPLDGCLLSAARCGNDGGITPRLGDGRAGREQHTPAETRRAGQRVHAPVESDRPGGANRRWRRAPLRPGCPEPAGRSGTAGGSRTAGRSGTTGGCGRGVGRRGEWPLRGACSHLGHRAVGLAAVPACDLPRHRDQGTGTFRRWGGAPVSSPAPQFTRAS